MKKIRNHGYLEMYWLLTYEITNQMGDYYKP